MSRTKRNATNFTDRYGFAVTASLYRLHIPGRTSIDVRVYLSEQSVWMIEDLDRPIGDPKRFAMLENLHPHTVFAPINRDRVLIEPNRKGEDCEGNMGRTMLDQLGELEQMALMARAELRRVELLTCRVLGCQPGNGDELSDAAFELAYNQQSAEKTLAIYERAMDRMEQTAKFHKLGDGGQQI